MSGSERVAVGCLGFMALACGVAVAKVVGVVAMVASAVAAFLCGIGMVLVVGAALLRAEPQDWLGENGSEPRR